MTSNIFKGFLYVVNLKVSRPEIFIRNNSNVLVYVTHSLQKQFSYDEFYKKILIYNHFILKTTKSVFLYVTYTVIKHLY